jgi:hypothetical protein
MTNKIIPLIIFLAAGLNVFGINIDTLQNDSLMQTTGIKLLFKGGTAYKTNKDGFVIEGTPAVDTDLWTTGPLVLFSPAGSLKFNRNGKVIQGALSVNILAECVDNRYREFKRGSRIFFSGSGLVFRGTLNESITVEIENQNVHSADNSPVEFYTSGKIKFITPSENFKFTTSDGVKIVVAAFSPVRLGEKGNLLSGYLAKKVSFSRNDETVSMSLGQMFCLDGNGNIIY